jgi:hypothetical protein
MEDSEERLTNLVSYSPVLTTKLLSNSLRSTNFKVITTSIDAPQKPQQSHLDVDRTSSFRVTSDQSSPLGSRPASCSPHRHFI